MFVDDLPLAILITEAHGEAELNTGRHGGFRVMGWETRGCSSFPSGARTPFFAATRTRCSTGPNYGPGVRKYCPVEQSA